MEIRAKFSPDLKENVKAHFNNLIAEEDDLGDILFDGYKFDFEMRLAEMNYENMKKYTSALHNEIIEI